MILWIILEAEGDDVVEDCNGRLTSLGDFQLVIYIISWRHDCNVFFCRLLYYQTFFIKREAGVTQK